MSQRELARRVEWAGVLVAGAAQRLVNRAWTPRMLARFEAADDQSFAWRTVEDLWGLPSGPGRSEGCSRFGRLAAEAAGEVLRGAVHRRHVLDAALAPRADDGRWPDLPAGVTAAEVKVRRRQIDTLAQKGQTVTGLFDVEPSPPRVPSILALGAADAQFSFWHTDDDGAVWQPNLSGDGFVAVLSVKLPTRRTPRLEHWRWHEITVRVHDIGDGLVHTSSPTLTVRNGKLRVTVPFDIRVDRPAPVVSRVLGLDWGPNAKFLTGQVVALDSQDRPSVTGPPVFFKSVCTAADHRRRTQAELLRGKADRIDDLLEGRHDARLAGKAAKHRAEAQQVHAARRRANRELARLAAGWAVAHAQAAGCDTIAIEQLGSLQPGRRGRRINTAVSISARGQLAEALLSACELAGIRLEPVKAEHTSQACHRCGRQVAFTTAPNNTKTGHRWARCTCGMTADRDANAAANIAVRALRQHRDTNTTARATKIPNTERPKHATDLGGTTLTRASRPVRPPAAATPARRSPTLRESSHARRASTPPHPRRSAVWVSQRRAGTSARTAPAVHADRNYILPVTRDGMRWAHRHHIRATPVPQMTWRNAPQSLQQDSRQ